MKFIHITFLILLFHFVASRHTRQTDRLQSHRSTPRKHHNRVNKPHYNFMKNNSRIRNEVPAEEVMEESELEVDNNDVVDESPSQKVAAAKSSSTSSYSDGKVESQGRANAFVDFVLNSFGSTVVSRRLQPLSLLDPPTKKIEFTRDMFGFLSTTGATLHNVSIARGLETISRIGDASVEKIEEDGFLIRNLTFAFELKNVEIQSNLSLKMMAFGPDVKFIGKTEQIVIHLKVGIVTLADDKNKKDFQIELNNLSIHEFVIMKFDVIGFWGPFNYIVKGISKVVVDFFRKPINKNIEGKMQKALTKLINKALESPISKSILSMALQFL